MARWSRLKAKIEDRICPALRGRIELRSTRYRKSADMHFHGGGRAYITLDGAEVFNMATHSNLPRLLELQSASDSREPWTRYLEAVATMGAEGEFTQFTFYHALDEYLNLSIEEALASQDVMIRALALIDRRLGKRRFERLAAPSGSEHPLIRQFYQLRAAAEGWAGSDPVVA